MFRHTYGSIHVALKSWILSASIFLSLCCPALAQSVPFCSNGASYTLFCNKKFVKQISPIKYPGNILSGATIAYGIEAYNAAWVASGPNKAINVFNQNTSTTQDINVLKTTGGLDIAGANAFGGTDATCTGSISGTTSLVLTGCSSTPKAGDQISGPGIVAPAFVIPGGCGTFTGGAGTCTLNAVQTVTGNVTIKFAVGLYINKFYDMSGNASDSATQGVAADRPILLTSCGVQPCIWYDGANMFIAPPNITLSQPYSSLAVVNRPTYPGSAGNWFRSNTGPVAFYSASVGGVANQMGASAGTAVLETMADGALHVAQAWFNGASSAINIDGTDYAGINLGTNGLGAAINIGRSSTVSQWFGGYLNMIIIWPSGSTSTPAVRTSLCTNMRKFWGSSGSC